MGVENSFIEPDEEVDIEPLVFMFEPNQKDVSSSTEDLLTGVLPLMFTNITRNSDVSTFTGLQGSKMFQIVFEYVRRKASMMKYWDGSKRTMRPKKRPSSVEAIIFANIISIKIIFL